MDSSVGLWKWAAPQLMAKMLVDDEKSKKVTDWDHQMKDLQSDFQQQQLDWIVEFQLIWKQTKSTLEVEGPSVHMVLPAKLVT